MEQSLVITITFIIYLLLMLTIGIFAYLKTQNSSDYFLGGRSLGPWPSAISAGASDMSGWLLLGLPGAAYISGLNAAWIAFGLLIGTWSNWLFMAKRLRTFSITTNSLTLPHFLAKRFNDNSNIIQSISALFILLFFLFYTSAGLVAGGKLFETVFHLDYKIAVVLGTLCVVSYTLFGGFLAVSWTDLVQGLMMAAALVIVPLVSMDSDFITLKENLININPKLLSLWQDLNNQPLTWITILSSLAWGLGYFGQPHILARFKATRSNHDLTLARRISVIWTAISLFSALLVGLVGLVYFKQHGNITLEDSERIFMMLVNAVFHPIMAGILLAAILAAIMSTADSQLLVSSSALSEDFYKLLFKKEATSDEIVKVGRWCVVIISLLALWLAMTPDSSVLNLVAYAWAGFGAAFGPVLLISLYWSGMNRFGAIAGIITGGLTIVIWKQLSGGIFDLYEIVPGFINSTIAIIVISLLTGRADKPVLEQFCTFKKQLKNLE